MKNSVRILLPVAATAVAAVSGYLVAQDKEVPQPAPLTIETDSRPIERVGGAQPTSYAPMLAKARQSVVSVYTSEVVRYVNRSCLLYTSPSPRDLSTSRMPSSA